MADQPPDWARRRSRPGPAPLLKPKPYWNVSGLAIILCKPYTCTRRHSSNSCGDKWYGCSIVARRRGIQVSSIWYWVPPVVCPGVATAWRRGINSLCIHIAFCPIYQYHFMYRISGFVSPSWYWNNPKRWRPSRVEVLNERGECVDCDFQNTLWQFPHMFSVSWPNSMAQPGGHWVLSATGQCTRRRGGFNPVLLVIFTGCGSVPQFRLRQGGGAEIAVRLLQYFWRARLQHDRTLSARFQYAFLFATKK